jgi:transposase
VSGTPKYPEQFRKDAVELVHASDRPLRQIARELGVNHETLRSWVDNATRDQAVPSNTTGSAEHQELRE